MGLGLSFVLEMEFDLDKALEEVPIHIEDPPFPSVRQEKRSSGFLSELPSEEGKKLEHFTKLRPKRNKKQQPTQAAVGGPRPSSLTRPSWGRLAHPAHRLAVRTNRPSARDVQARFLHLVLSTFGKDNSVKFQTLQNRVAFEHP